ncbi:MAG TPA: Lrp/AsnC family transcriptional regulator [Pseudonocardiaceae bacterium]|nr:Lrp/AsnC family transcriptional regulator [Pseudonocardiaceae bacterium]
MKSHTFTVPRPQPLPAFDLLDRQLLHALQLNGRAPFSRIAEVLGVSDQTIARRYSRLRTSGALRVIGATDPAVLGEIAWFVRVQCAPDVATPVAEAIARREDTTWVSLTSGGTEIVCVSRAGTDSENNSLLLQKLPRTPRVQGVTAQCILHNFFGGTTGLVDKHGFLSETEIERLRPEPGSAEVDPGPLTEADQKLFAVLARDGRAGHAELAAATGWSQSTVRRRLAELLDSGVLYLDLEFDRRILDLDTRAMLWLTVAPADLVAAGNAMAAHLEVAFAAAVTGQTNLAASVVCSDVAALYTYLTEKVARLPGIQRVESAPVIRTVKSITTNINP